MIINPVAQLNKKLTVPLAHAIKDIPWITPNRLTWLSLLFSVFTSLEIIYGKFQIAAVLNYIAALLDSLDGDLARIRGTGGPKGALLDAVLDRYADILVLAGFILNSPADYLIPGLAAILGSVVVPYTRAKCEALELPVAGSFGSRDIRQLIITLGLLLNIPGPTLCVLAVISNLSGIHRLWSGLR